MRRENVQELLTRAESGPRENMDLRLFVNDLGDGLRGSAQCILGIKQTMVKKQRQKEGITKKNRRETERERNRAKLMKMWSECYATCHGCLWLAISRVAN